MKARRFLWGAALAAALLSLPRPGVTAPEEQGFTPIPVIKGLKLLEKGTPAPAFTVKDLDGKVFEFATEQKQRAHLLVFWSIFCEPCREEMPSVEKMTNEFKNSGLAVLAVNLDGEPFADGIRGFVKQYKYSFRILLDELSGEQFRIADPYQVAGTPVVYLVDAQGTIFWSNLGRTSEAELKEKIVELLGKK